MLTNRTLPALAVAAVLALGAGAGRADASSEVQAKMVSFAKQIKDVVTEGGGSECAVGEFSGPPSPESASGPGLQNLLITALKGENVGNNPKASIIVKGEYARIEDENKPGEVLLQLTVSMKNIKGKKLGDLTATLNHKANDEIVKILALQVELSNKPKADPPTRNEEINKQIDKPPVYHDDTKTKTTPESPYAVEVLVRRYGETKFELVKPEIKDGNTFVDLKKGDVYKLRLINNSKHESAASVTIDGVDAFAFFEPAADRPSAFLIQPSAKREVEGWTRNTKKLNEFKVGSFSDSAAAQVLKSPAKVGTITVCFHPCWTGKPPREYDGSRSVEPNATGLGDEIERGTKVLPRTIGPLLTAITIRYNK